MSALDKKKQSIGQAFRIARFHFLTHLNKTGAQLLLVFPGYLSYKMIQISLKTLRISAGLITCDMSDLSLIGVVH